MDVRLGISHTAKEIHVELPDGTDQDKLIKEIESTLGGAGAMLWLTDRKGRRVGIPSDKVAWVEVGSQAEDRKVGFAR